MSAKPRKVDFIHNIDDLKAATLGALGFSTRFISETTGLTPCQVGYRLGRAEVKRSDYRNGESAEARTVIRSVVQVKVGDDLKKRIRRRLKAMNKGSEPKAWVFGRTA